MAEPVVRIPDAKVALSTASVYPESTATAFEIAARLGYDGVEVMVWNDPVSQDIDALRRLSDFHRIPILAVHAPCLLITQRVWSTDPWTKLQRARAAAEKLGASTVVVHPPFRWQRQYARDFVTGIWRMADETDVRFAVENMYPWRYRDREMLAYAPDWDVTKDDYRHFTIDLSHAATSRTDAMGMVDRMADRLGHVHLADGNGSAKDEHLVPGRGSQPCAELLERLALTGFDGHVVIEVNTRRAMSGAEREADLAEALAFTRLHLASASRGAPGTTGAPASSASPASSGPSGSPSPSPASRASGGPPQSGSHSSVPAPSAPSAPPSSSARSSRRSSAKARRR
ncbi:sugar phosphate isomerase/epimerase family protein [Streptomyces sp. NBC_00704]|uniref:sugar phosphate isomerase/epimerase family protein n=1 Tax=Streptomyces sp. NBC_00704 TaxID=2975809 RepID=UPI002E327DF6|nr:sugar phosphate isomerase/epimerase [Streptomyces sp. NBC_00704]